MDTWDLARERDACGIGFVADAEGRPSRHVVEAALEALYRVRHRGAVAADARTGDGAGLLLPIPRRMLSTELTVASSGGTIDPSRLGLAMLFSAPDVSGADVRRALTSACRAEGIDVLSWREVPTEPAALGPAALETMPRVLQAVLVHGATGEGVGDGRSSEAAAFRARRRAEAVFRLEGLAVYVVSLSFSTVTYKALVAADQLSAFYPDLRSDLFEGWFAIFHQRYATNTTSSWQRAQPFRMLCHNGEINTIDGNRRHMQGREGRLGAGSRELEELLRPVLDEEGSDSSMLDDAVALLTMGRPDELRDVREAIAMLVPPAWQGDVDLEAPLFEFLRWHARRMEPWDGPAGLVFCDGRRVGAAQDRNGLRPLHLAVCDDGFVACCSEAGAVATSGHGLVRRDRIAPGRMVIVDPSEGGFSLDPLRAIARRRPYPAWTGTRTVIASEPRHVTVPADLQRLQVAHGYTREDLALILRSIASHGKEPTFSMGDDTAIPPLSEHRRPLHHFFRQRFAQVTNPAIDHLRERFVTSLQTFLGCRGPLLDPPSGDDALVELESFLLATPPREIPLPHADLDATWAVKEGPSGLLRALDRLAAQAIGCGEAVAPVLVVNHEAVGTDRAPVPSLMAVGAVHAALCCAGLRTRTSIVASADDAAGSHHLACLVGFGADAVFPRLALATVASIASSPADDVDGSDEHRPNADPVARFRVAMEDGVLKVMARLGIACVDSYRGAQAFDALGLGPEVIDLCFPRTATPVGGLGFEDFAADVLARHAEAYGPSRPVPVNTGFAKFRRGGEYHANNPDNVRALHEAVDPGLRQLRSTAAASTPAPTLGEPAATADGDGLGVSHALRRAAERPHEIDAYERFARLVDERPPAEIRDLLDLVPEGPPVPIDEVEPAAAILRRFSTGAISHGAVSREAHETLAIAMNRIGARSNSGEGGEDRARFRTERNSRIKQIASGRFGVTPEYCAFADELQIKIAQGSKPGEGGQIPGFKVTEEIARLRHTQPGIDLFSPAPHHDVYSIEDLSQLIFDLKQVNPEAEVSVKLVAEVGVGTIAAGVAKALAEIVHISGADGGTGASPLSSIKHAGLPWEIGLAEAQQVLSVSGLRGRVRLRVDGGFRTGRDVLIAALLGADEYSFGTAVLLAEGCVMVRTCHLDTCPVGIATQRPELRKRFAGTPEMVTGYLTTVAEHVRRLLAVLGLSSLDEAIGRVDLLRPTRRGGRAERLDLTGLLGPVEGERRFVAHEPLQRPRSDLGDLLFERAWPHVRNGGIVELGLPITNEDRAVGARLGGAIGRGFGETPPPGRVRMRFRGTAGQSFGAFVTQGLELHLVGEANDYVGKGMAGGRIIIVPPDDDAGQPSLAGNTLLYGATGGELFVAGRVGERFAVRNSGAVAVVEGAGSNACEYMTGGTVVVLGRIGLNLGAGMTGGHAYVHAPDQRVPERVHPGTVECLRPEGADLETLRQLLHRHHQLTGSNEAAALLAEWPAAGHGFWHVRPKDVRTDVGVLVGTGGGRAQATGL